MTYTVHSLFKTLQGEGANTGRVAVFCRFAGCNLWSGRERDRATSQCTFCDTVFVGPHEVGGGTFAHADLLADAIHHTWALGSAERFVVFTGGEPLLQVDTPLLTAVHKYGFKVAVETNGTIAALNGIDWICVSPKAGVPLRQLRGHEIKLVFPQVGIEPEHLAHLEFDHFWLSPLDNPARIANTSAAVAYCLDHPQWRLSLQTHKFIGIP